MSPKSCFGMLFVVFLYGGSAGAARPVSQTAIQNSLLEVAHLTHVPSCLLRAIAEVESHSVHRAISPTAGGLITGEIPKSYGLMGLRDDDFFGKSLNASAQLIGETPEKTALDYQSNILGAARYLKSLVDEVPGESCLHIEKWKRALEKYSGIPGADANSYAEQVIETARNFEPHFAAVRLNQSRAEITWDPSPNIGGTLHPKYIVIHTTESSFASAKAWFKNPRSQASAHYVIRSSDGAITQMVADDTIAWHARCWNDQAIGIEHEANSSDGSGLSVALYNSSAELVRRLAQKYNIPLDAEHIIGHDYWETEQFRKSPLGDCQDHNDPGRYWDWRSYFTRLIRNVST